MGKYNLEKKLSKALLELNENEIEAILNNTNKIIEEYKKIIKENKKSDQ